MRFASLSGLILGQALINHPVSHPLTPLLFSPATLPQMALANFLENGSYDRHLRKMKVTLQKQLNNTMEAIIHHFPDGTRISRPTGGLVLWIELSANIDAMDLHESALKEKISIAPGPIFTAQKNFKNFIRIGCGLPFTKEVEDAIETLRNIIKKSI